MTRAATIPLTSGSGGPGLLSRITAITQTT